MYSSLKWQLLFYFSIFLLLWNNSSVLHKMFLPFQVIFNKGRHGADLYGVSVVGWVLKQPIIGIEELLRQKEKEFSGRATVVQPGKKKVQKIKRGFLPFEWISRVCLHWLLSQHRSLCSEVFLTWFISPLKNWFWILNKLWFQNFTNIQADLGGIITGTLALSSLFSCAPKT